MAAFESHAQGWAFESPPLARCAVSFSETHSATQPRFEPKAPSHCSLSCDSSAAAPALGLPARVDAGAHRDVSCAPFSRARGAAMSCEAVGAHVARFGKRLRARFCETFLFLSGSLALWLSLYLSLAPCRDAMRAATLRQSHGQENTKRCALSKKLRSVPTRCTSLILQDREVHFRTEVIIGDVLGHPH